MEFKAWNMSETDKDNLEHINKKIKNGAVIERIKFDYFNNRIWIDWKDEGKNLTTAIKGEE